MSSKAELKKQIQEHLKAATQHWIEARSHYDAAIKLIGEMMK